MRRSQGVRAPTAPYLAPSQHVEEQNEALTNELGNKIGALKSLSIEIVNEVRYQDRELRLLSEEMEGTGGLLGSSRKRIARLVRSGSRHHFLYLVLFCVLVSVLLWMCLKAT